MDESGNIYIIGSAYSGDLPLKNAFNSTYCGYSEGTCFFLTIFNFQGLFEISHAEIALGQLLMSTWLDMVDYNSLSIAVSRLSDGGHLVYLSGTTYNLEMQTMEAYQYNITDPINNYEDGFIKIFYVSPQCRLCCFG